MVENKTMTRVESDDLTKGDEVTVHVNSRAAGHLGCRKFEAVVENAALDDIQFKRKETGTLHTWYSDIGYIHGYHEGLDRHSDIGKVAKVTQ